MSLPDKRCRLTLILGGVGMGKSTLASALLSHQCRQVVIDPRAEHDGDLVCDSFDSFLAAFENGRNLDAGTRIVCRQVDDAADYRDHLFRFLGRCEGWGIMVDEADEFCSPQTIIPEFRRLLNYRRHFRIPLIICIARRPAAVHRDLSALADTIIVFNLHERRDLDYIRFACGDAFAAAVRNLPPFQYLRKEFPDVK